MFRRITEKENKMEWCNKFWSNHGERLTFAILALLLSGVMYTLKLEKEANTIIIGIAMLFFNKSRGTDGAGK